MHRRNFLTYAAISGILPIRSGFARSAPPHIVIIGGGFGGATCAKYLKVLDPTLQVTVVEPNPQIMTCPFSNTVLGGWRQMTDITWEYTALRERHGVTVMTTRATAVDPVARTVTLATGEVLQYEKLVMSPGVAFKPWDGYDDQRMPHAWQAGPQTLLLRRQLEAMDDGGLVLITVPGEPYRCPPGPYERAAVIAHYLKAHKPKSKILILDAKETFSKQKLFQAAWAAEYPGMIEWVSGSSGGLVEAIDGDALVTQGGFERHTGAVINAIPPQRAADLAVETGLADDTGFCPVTLPSFESALVPHIHVLGDAAKMQPMPKSAHSANGQAKQCAAGLVAQLHDLPPPAPLLVNTCYSFIAPDYSISVSGVYRGENGQLAAVAGAGGVSPADESRDFRSREAVYAEGWYASIIADSFS